MTALTAILARVRDAEIPARGVLSETLHGAIPMRTVARLADAVLAGLALAAECERLRERVRVLEDALRDIAGYEMPTSGSVAHQVCADMRDDARAALKGTP